MIVTQPHPNVYSFTNVLSLEPFILLSEEFDSRYSHWRMNKAESSGVNSNNPMRGCLSKPLREGTQDSRTLGDNLQLIKIGSFIKIHTERVLQKKLHMYRINTNIQLYGMPSEFHLDGDLGDWTFLLFCQDTWNSEWGGEFVMKDVDDIYKYFAYIPNNGVLFPAFLPHKGNEPNRLCHLPRLSIAFSFSECVV